jgi:hypothetical protein
MVLRKHIRDTWATGTYYTRRAGVLLLGYHIRVTLRTNTRCGKSIIPHTMLLSQNIHIRVTLTRYTQCGKCSVPYGCPAARESYPGYFTNKYPLREIKHPAYTPTGNKSFSESISGLLGQQPVPIPGTRAGALLLGNHIRVILRTNTRCGKSIIPHTQCRSFSKHTYPGCVKTVYTQCGKYPVRVSCCSGIISGLLYEQIPAAGNQISRTPPHGPQSNLPPTTQYTVPDLIPLRTEPGVS